MFVQSPDQADDISDHLLRLGSRLSVAGIAPAASIRIDLTRDVEDLRDGLTSARCTENWTAAITSRSSSPDWTVLR
ncbi:MAG: hypothetical protein ACRDSG_14160 [Pseudonocardiaceae bacterium]